MRPKSRTKLPGTLKNTADAQDGDVSIRGVEIEKTPAHAGINATTAGRSAVAPAILPEPDWRRPLLPAGKRRMPAECQVQFINKLFELAD